MNGYELKDSGERQQFKTGAVRDTARDKPRPDLISPHANMREGMVMTKGAEKYAERNWEQGIPISRCIASACRHIEQYKLGQTDEDHLAQARTNLSFALHFEEEIKAGRMDAAINDMPKYQQQEMLGAVFCSDEANIKRRRDLLQRIDDSAEFCRYCGAHIPPRLGEGTCEKCDSAGAVAHQIDLNLAAPVAATDMGLKSWAERVIAGIPDGDCIPYKTKEELAALQTAAEAEIQDTVDEYVESDDTTDELDDKEELQRRIDAGETLNYREQDKYNDRVPGSAPMKEAFDRVCDAELKSWAERVIAETPDGGCVATRTETEREALRVAAEAVKPNDTPRLPIYYITGPMRGYPAFNFPMFDEAAEYMQNYYVCHVISPAAMDRELGINPEEFNPGETLSAATLEQIIRRDCDAILGLCPMYDGMVLLPGWERSTGARAEVALALWLGLETFYEYRGGSGDPLNKRGVTTLPYYTVRDRLFHQWSDQCPSHSEELE